MKYITKLILENFQSHKYSEIDFKPDLNVIVGPSDTGKSAIIRALKWVLYNEPSGDFFIREGESNCSVTIHISDGTILQRYRTKSKNGYLLVKSDGEEMRFEGFGKDVPEEIINITNIKKILLDRDESSAINMGEQLEGPFLLSEKTSVRANAIGRLVGVNIIDDALTDVLKDMKNLNTSRKNTEKRIEVLLDEIKEYEYLDQLRFKLSKLTNLNILIKEKKLKLSRIITLKSNYDNTKLETKEVESTNSKLKELNKVENNIKDIEIDILKFNILHTYNLNYKNMILDSMHNTNLLEKLLPLGKIESNIKEMEYKLIKYNRLNRIYTKQVATKNENLLLSNKLTNIDSILKFEKEYKVSKENRDLLNKLSSLRLKLYEVKSRERTGVDYLLKLEKFVSIDDRLTKSTNNLNLLQQLNANIKKYYNISIESKEIHKEINNLEFNINNLLDRYKEILAELEKCPFCNSDINSESIDSIIKNHLGG